MATSWKMSLVRDLCRFASDICLLDERFKDTNITFLSWSESINNIVPFDEQGCLTINYAGKSNINVIEHYLKDNDSYILITDGSCELKKLESNKFVCLLVGDEVEIERVNLKLKTFSAANVYAAFEYLIIGGDMMYV
jgi:hypothetical protein